MAATAIFSFAQVHCVVLRLCNNLQLVLSLTGKLLEVILQASGQREAVPAAYCSCCLAFRLKMLRAVAGDLGKNKESESVQNILLTQ